MIFPAADQIRVIRTGGGGEAALVEMLSANGWAERAEWLKQDERSTVLAGDSAAGPVVVKSLLVDRPKDLLSRALGVTRLMRQWRGAEVLALRGFVVARPLVLWRGRDDAGRVVESLAMERHAGKTVLRHLADGDLSAEMEAAVARRIGEDVARLARLGLVNRDHKPSNLLLHPSEPQAASLKPVIAILDTVGVRRSRSPREAAVRMLFGLTVECVGTGVLPRLSTRLTVVRAAAAGLGLPRREVAWLWLDVRERLGRHGDPRPRVDPLG